MRADGKSMEGEALHMAAEAIGVFPYMIQLIGCCTWMLQKVLKRLPSRDPANPLYARRLFKDGDELGRLVESATLRVAHLRQNAPFAGGLDQVARRPFGYAELRRNILGIHNWLLDQQRRQPMRC